MSTHTITTTEVVSTRPLGRAGQIWLAFVQSLVLALTALGLYWARSESTSEVDVTHRALLAGVALLLLVVILVPRWRRSELVMVLSSLMLATAAWISHHARLIDTENWRGEWSTDFALILPFVLGVGLLASLSGLAMRAGILGESRLGRGALLACGYLLAATLLFFLLITRAPSLQQAALNYDFPVVHVQELFATALLYGGCLWLGGLAIRRDGQQIFLPFGQVALAIFFLILWQVR